LDDAVHHPEENHRNSGKYRNKTGKNPEKVPEGTGEGFSLSGHSVRLQKRAISEEI
jgi:hypothetical protein